MQRPLLVIGLSMLLAACGSHEKNKDYAAMNELPMQTVCVGRMLVDLPKGQMDWQQSFGFAQAEKIPPTINTKEKFDRLVANRKQELSNEMENIPRGRLYHTEKLGDNYYILQYRDETLPEKGVHTVRYIWLKHWGYKLITGGTFIRRADELLTRIRQANTHLTPIQNIIPPSKPGFCIDSALVTGRIGPIGANTSVRVPSWKGVTLFAGAMEDDGSQPPLSWQKGKKRLQPQTPFERLEASESTASSQQSGFQIIRKRARELANMNGQEVAFKVTLDNGQEYYHFIWSSTDRNNLPNDANFGFDLRAGAEHITSNYKAPPEEDKLLALWDAAVNSLKPRPGA